MHLYAAPSYLERFGQPKTIADLDNHRIVTFGVPVPPYLSDVNWLEVAGRDPDNPREPSLRINNIFSIKNAVTRGIGIAVLPDYMVEPGFGLERLLPEAEVPSFATYFVYPAELKNSARVHVFRDFLLSPRHRTGRSDLQSRNVANISQSTTFLFMSPYLHCTSFWQSYNQVVDAVIRSSIPPYAR